MTYVLYRRSTLSRFRGQEAARALVGTATLATIFLYAAYMLDNGGKRVDQSYIGSDTLQPTFVAHDFLQSPGLLTQWSFPDAPYFFPDLVYALLTAPLSAFPLLHTTVLGLVQGGAAIALAMELLRRNGGMSSVTAFGLGLALLGGFFLLSAALEHQLKGMMQTYGILFKIWYHTGALTLTLLLLIIDTTLDRENDTKRYIILFTAHLSILSLAILSDKLMIIFYAAPMACIRLWQYVAGEMTARRFLATLATMIGATGLALAGQQLLELQTNMRAERWDTLAEIAANAESGFRFLALDLTNPSTPPLYQALQILIKVPVLLATAAIAACVLPGWTAKLRSAFPSAQAWTLFRFWIAGYWINGLAIFSSGLYRNTWSNRYLLVTDLAWLFLTALLAAGPGRPALDRLAGFARRHARSLVAGLGAGIAVYAVTLSGGALYDFIVSPHAAVRPPVRCVPSEFLPPSGEKARLALGSTGVARRGTAETGRRLFILAVQWDGTPNGYTSSAAHYTPAYLESRVELDGPALIFTNGLDASALRRRFGPPAEVLSCPQDDSILVYENARQIQRRLTRPP